MPKYLMLSSLSEQGLQTLRANPDRVREVNKDVEEMGARSCTSGSSSVRTTS